MNFKKNFKLSEVEFIHFTNLISKEKELVLKLRNSEVIRKGMFGDNIISLDEHLGFIETLRQDMNSAYWMVKDKAGSFIGVFDLTRIDLPHKHAYLGIYANIKSGRRGQGSLIMSAGKELVFQHAKFHTLKLEVLKENLPAIRFYEKHGFKLEGVLSDLVYKDNKWHDVVVMGALG